jgi:hypothetical protein
MKAIRQAQTRDILDAYDKEDISYSRMNEMFNELAEEFAIGFAMAISTHCYCDLGNDTRSYKELLEIYKKEKGL